MSKKTLKCEYKDYCVNVKVGRFGKYNDCKNCDSETIKFAKNMYQMHKDLGIE